MSKKIKIKQLGSVCVAVCEDSSVIASTLKEAVDFFKESHPQEWKQFKEKHPELYGK